MDVQTLLAESKARFNHNSAKLYLTEKYNAKLIVADQGGLWRADSQTITLLSASVDKQMILLDTFSNPVKVYRSELLDLLGRTYATVMTEWHQEWQELGTKR